MSATNDPREAGDPSAVEHVGPAFDGWWVVILSCGCMVNRTADDQPLEGDDWCCPEHGDDEIAEEVRWHEPAAGARQTEPAGGSDR